MRGHTTTMKITLTGLMAALICLLGPFSVPLPFSPVPLSLCTMVIYFAVYVLGAGLGTCSVAIYLLLGLVGLPVFSGFAGGIGRLLGPTGGYLIGYLFIICISGWFIKKWGASNTPRNFIICFFGMTLGTIVCYLFGTLWLSYQLSLDFTTALSLGPLPYIPLDILKMILALLLGKNVKKRLNVAGIF